MAKNDTVKEKRVLIVDDEPDILETLEELLTMYQTVKAASFNEAKKLLETEAFDIAILDIMGVDGYGLLDVANEKLDWRLASTLRREEEKEL